METNTFDRFVSRWSSDASRRQMLGGLLGALTAIVAGRTALQAKPKQASRNRRRGSGAGAATDNVAICHVTNGRTRAERIRVGRRALKAHLAHGDTRFVDCCVNEDCHVPECFSAQCVSGTCSQTQLPPGATCTIGGGSAIGNCTAEGQCMSTGGGGADLRNMSTPVETRAAFSAPAGALPKRVPSPMIVPANPGR